MDALPVPTDKIPQFCQRWHIRELSFIGSVLRPDFTAASDIDVVVTFQPDQAWDLFDIIKMRDELAVIFGRSVDLIEEPAVRNPYMLASIRRSKRVLYAA